MPLKFSKLFFVFVGLQHCGSKNCIPFNRSGKQNFAYNDLAEIWENISDSEDALDFSEADSIIHPMYVAGDVEVVRKPKNLFTLVIHIGKFYSITYHKKSQFQKHLIKQPQNSSEKKMFRFSNSKTTFSRKS